MLLFFHGEECEHCKAMGPLITRLEQELGVQVERKETWHNKENAELLVKSYDPEGSHCGGVPFFYNTDNRQWLCGEVEYDALLRWAESTNKHGK